jgi:3',5'-cyclic AMP phosphodiesterase CpdA
MKSFSFVVLADSHIRSETETNPAYPSDRSANTRHAYAMRKIRQIAPDFVIHLGDVVHPIPALASHDSALKTAREHYDSLDCPVYVTPGNHDVGDKPNSWVPAPNADSNSHDHFETTWGKPWRAFDYHDNRFLILNTSLMNTELAPEVEQEKWLEQDLVSSRRAGKRIFVSMHYPLYIDSPAENDHYDNIAEPARSRLLCLLADHGVEAVFCGHAHTFFYNRFRDMDLYTVPSLTFVRPGYSELFQIPPGPEREYGRYDTDKLGFMLVSVTAREHRLRLIHTYGRGENEELTPWDGLRLQEAAVAVPEFVSPVGVTLRHTWAHSYELPFDNLDEFNRKLARNDHWLPALWEMGIQRVRLPVDDLSDDNRRRRISALIEKGFRFTFFSAGMPSDRIREILRRHHRLMEAWEVIVPQYRMAEVLRDIETIKADIPVRTYLSKLAHTSQADFDDGTHFHHFADHGFNFEDLPFIKTSLDKHPGGGAIDGVVFSSGRQSILLENIQAAAGVLGVDGAAVIVQVVFPRVDEGVICDRDQDVANLAAEALAAAHAVNKAIVFFDTFVDHDRGYYPRHGLLDRRYNPRIGLHVLSRLRDVLQTMGPIDTAETIASLDGIRAVAIHAADRKCVLVMSEGSEATLELSAAEIAVDDQDRLHWIDLASGNKYAVQLRRSAADPQRLTIDPNPTFGAPGVLTITQPGQAGNGEMKIED